MMNNKYTFKCIIVSMRNHGEDKPSQYIQRSTNVQKWTI